MTDLRCNNLSMTFTNPQTGAAVEALKDINFTLKQGELLSVLGPSGCGKTTLLNIIAGFVNPTAGMISLGDMTIKGPGVERGMVFQQGALFEWLPVAKNVDFGLRMKKQDEKEAVALVEKWLDIVGLQGFGDTPTYQLSGGMQQRVGIARALANYPRVLLMDEPFGALDSQTRSLMQENLLALWRDLHITVVFVTHDIDEAVLLADRILVMGSSPGRVVCSLDVSLPRPRSSESTLLPEFLSLRKQCLDLIRLETMTTFEN